MATASAYDPRPSATAHAGPGEGAAAIEAQRAERRAVFLAIALSGFTALSAEVVWTRVLSLLFGGTTYTFSLILAGFLLGLGIGSSLGSALARTLARPAMALGWAQAGACAAVAWAAVMMGSSMPYWPIDPSLSTSPWFNFQLDAARCLWVVLPGAILWGASFPLALAAELIQLGCQLDRWGYAECPQDSPLQRFGCDFIVDPGGVDYGLEPKIPLVAVCKKETEEHELAKIEGVYLVGCAFKYEIHYIFKLGAEYILVSKADELKDLFAPIDSPDEALSYAQMVTGLEAMYNFAFFPTLMYFHESIEGTHAQTDGGFEMNLFNFEACSCEPFINTQINIQVDRPGTITWVDAVPVFMTPGWSCAD